MDSGGMSNSMGGSAVGVSSSDMNMGAEVSFEKSSMEGKIEEGVVFEKESSDSLNVSKLEADSNMIMQIPGTPHDKLTALSDMEFDDLSEDNEQPDVDQPSNDDQVEDDKSLAEDRNIKEPSPEQEIIKLQAEALKLLAQSMNSRVNEKEKDELLEKLKKLLEQLGESEQENKGYLIAAVLSVVIILLNIGEKGAKAVENEVKKAES